MNKIQIYYGNCVTDPFLTKKIGCNIESPVFYINDGNESIIVPAGDVHYFRKKSHIKNINTFSDLSLKFNDTDIIKNVCRLFPKNKTIVIPGSTPIKLYAELQKLNLRIEVSDFSYVNCLLKKNVSEIENLIKHGRTISLCFSELSALLSKTKIINKKIYYQSKLLDVKTLKIKIANMLLENDFEPNNMLVYAGHNTCNSHFNGNHPIVAGMPLIVDLYPKHSETGLYVDMTRTFMIGKPRFKEYAQILQDIEQIQLQAERMMHRGKKISEFSKYVDKIFVSKGYHTKFSSDSSKKIRYVCTHSFGHGIGYAVHEPPTLSTTANVPFEKNMVMALECGLYNSKRGGFRIEDDYIIQDTSALKITTFKDNYLL